MALAGQQAYLNRLQHPTEAPEVDPALLTFQQRADAKFEDDQAVIEKHIKTFHEGGSDAIARMEAPINFTNSRSSSRSSTDSSKVPLSTRRNPSVVRHTQFDVFGSISVLHGSIFSVSADVAVIPTTPNFMPPEGLGLETLERGGKPMVEAVTKTLKRVMEARRHAVLKNRHRLSSPEFGGSSQHFRIALDSSTTMFPGDILVVPSLKASSTCPYLAFVVLPYFFEGGYNEASSTLREAIVRAFRYLQYSFVLPTTKAAPTSIALPMLGADIHGFQPRNLAENIIEESIEALLELSVVEPAYQLKRIFLVSDKEYEVSVFCRSLEAAATRWLPDQQIVSARRYLATRSKRVIRVSDNTLQRLRSPCKFFYKSHESARKPTRSTFCGHIRPFVWRARVRQSPSLQVHKRSGVPVTPSPPMKDYLTDQTRNYYRFKRLRVVKGEWTANTDTIKRHRERRELRP